MKKTYLTIFAVLSALQISHAQWMTSGNNMYNQNTGNVGIGTSTPAGKLDVNGSIALKGIVTNDAIDISTGADGTYVIASGSQIKGTYSLSFEGPNRLQTAVLLVDASQFNGGTNTLSILSNNPYNSNEVMSNFRLYKAADGGGVYLVCDVANRGGGTYVRANFSGNGYSSPNWGGSLPSGAFVYSTIPIAVSYGNVGIGTTETKGYKFAVNGSAIATSMKVKLNNIWPDFVFLKDYKLPTLTEVKTYIDNNQHLPDMPSAHEVNTNGLDLGEMNRLLLKKVEELTLYLIQQDAKISEYKAKHEAQLKQQRVQIEKLKIQLSGIRQ